MAPGRLASPRIPWAGGGGHSGGVPGLQGGNPVPGPPGEAAPIRLETRHAWGGEVPDPTWGKRARRIKWAGSMCLTAIRVEGILAVFLRRRGGKRFVPREGDGRPSWGLELRGGSLPLERSGVNGEGYSYLASA